MARQSVSRGILLVLVIGHYFTVSTIASSRTYTGQKVFTDADIIDFIDPAKHGFHIVLNERFVHTHLQPIRLPTIFATAIALKQFHWHHRRNDVTNATGSSVSRHSDGLRVTKVLYPENVEPEGGLLDGRTIQLLGLKERTWYYVCVEFESNINRHESATGASCLLKRTLDRFGKSADSTISEVELSETTERAIAVKLRVETDFPLRLSIYLSQEQEEDSTLRSVPSQTFIVERRELLNVVFGPHLEPDTSYGSLCILEEPLAFPEEPYTAMGRNVRVINQRCYFDNLKTNHLPPPSKEAVTSQLEQRSQLAYPHKIRALTGRNSASKIVYSFCSRCMLFLFVTSIALVVN